MVIGPVGVERAWPNIKRAFGGFNIDKVAMLTESEIQEMLRDVRIVRNRKKMRATIQNAGAFRKIRAEYGSFERYLESYFPDYQALVKDLNSRMRYVGETSIRAFLECVGEPAARWRRAA